ncbi:MAG: hypothetical protein FWH35_00760 [Treponema sp.]|nr:hypothetical protein [Treponema sp.]
MDKIAFFILLCTGLVLFPNCKEKASNTEPEPIPIPEVTLSIRNNTGTQITQIIISETDSEMEPIVFNRNIPKETTTIIQLKRNVLYDLILINVDERQYVKRRQAWDEDTASIFYENKDIVDRNVWDKIKRVILWPKY